MGNQIYTLLTLLYFLKNLFLLNSVSLSAWFSSNSVVVPCHNLWRLYFLCIFLKCVCLFFFSVWVNEKEERPGRCCKSMQGHKDRKLLRTELTPRRLKWELQRGKGSDKNFWIVKVSFGQKVENEIQNILVTWAKTFSL